MSRDRTRETGALAEDQSASERSKHVTGHSLEGSPEEVLEESALKAFDKDRLTQLH